MNPLYRVATQIARSHSKVKRVVFRPTVSFTPRYSSRAGQSSEAATKTAVDWPRPSEIPFQAKVANSVNLIGYVNAPIQFKTSLDGKDWAGTVIIQKAYSVPLWIPVLFEGDLAHIAASHLKKDDRVHIAGQLTADPPALDGIEGQANVQVMVHSLNFIEPSFQTNNSFTLKKQEAAAVGHSASKKKGNDAALRAWRDLLDNPQQWQDCRSDKLKGLVSKRYPDFRRKDGSLALWLNSAPDWVLSELEGVVSDVQTYESNNVKKSQGDDFWRDLLKNPGKWWDNRSDKRSAKSPDFKHKESGKALWLTDAPDWVKSELPSVESKQNAASGKSETLLS